MGLSKEISVNANPGGRQKVPKRNWAWRSMKTKRKRGEKRGKKSDLNCSNSLEG